MDWFFPALETPNIGLYPISARDVRFHNELYDAGQMLVVGAKRIEGPNEKASERAESPGAESGWREQEVIYAQPCAAFDLSLELEPGLELAQLASIKPFVVWSSDDGTTTYDESSPLTAHHVASRDIGTYKITASCGDSKRVILVKVGVPKIHKVSFLGDIDIEKDDGSGVYDDTDWKDDDLDGESDLTGANANLGKRHHPIAYPSTGTLSAKATFRIGCTKVSDATAFIPQFDAEARIQKLRFAPDNRLFGWSWSSPVPFNAQETQVTAASPFRSVATVGYEPEYELAWEIGFGDDESVMDDLSWQRSISQHELYLTYKSNQPSYETVFHVSCTGANGATTDQGVIEGVWSKFAGKNVTRKDNAALFYYASYKTRVLCLEFIVIRCPESTRHLW